MVKYTCMDWDHCFFYMRAKIYEVKLSKAKTLQVHRKTEKKQTVQARKNQENWVKPTIHTSKKPEVKQGCQKQRKALSTQTFWLPDNIRYQALLHMCKSIAQHYTTKLKHFWCPHIQPSHSRCVSHFDICCMKPVVKKTKLKKIQLPKENHRQQDP